MTDLKTAFEEKFIAEDPMSGLPVYTQHPGVLLQFIAEREALARAEGIQEALACVERVYPMDAFDTPIGVMRVHADIKKLSHPTEHEN